MLLSLSIAICKEQTGIIAHIKNICFNGREQKGVFIMTAKRMPDYDAFVSEEKNGKHWYTNVGAAWKVAKDGISVKLTALPPDGDLVLFPHKAKPSQ
jgi:hypothetical protein